MFGLVVIGKFNLGFVLTTEHGTGGSFNPTLTREVNRGEVVAGRVSSEHLSAGVELLPELGHGVGKLGRRSGEGKRDRTVPEDRGRRCAGH